MSWFGYVSAEELAKAQEAARAESRRANEEKERAAQEKRDADIAKAGAIESAISARHAQEQARIDNQRANEERERAEKERRNAAIAKADANVISRRAAEVEAKAQKDKRAAEEAKAEAAISSARARLAEQQAQKENQRANMERERAETERMAAEKLKQEAMVSGKRAHQAEEKAQEEHLRALEALEMTKRHRERAEKAIERAEKEARKSSTTAGQIEGMNLKMESVQKEKQRLQDEREEKKRRDACLMQFAWGPKNTERTVWTSQEVQRLRDKFHEHKYDKGGRLIHGKILIFGPSGTGKSSFCNGLRAALKDSATPANYYAVGSIGSSLTGSFQASQYGPHWIIDMPGIFESSDLKTENIEDIVSGRVRFDAQITKTLDAKGNLQEARRDVSCVVLVLHHGLALGDELKRQLNAIIRRGGEGALSYHLVLTHLDECDPQFKDPGNIPNLYKSPLVQEAVKTMSDQTGIPAYAISYVKNYVTETETDTNTKLLHLRALDRILTSTADQVEKMIDFKLQKNMYDDSSVNRNVLVFISAAMLCFLAMVYMCTQ
ncbi:uncharacterized protein LOC125372513 isoform X2 [Haliotis rufescens]|uniref:uncharacterized protein LOC125372513 isoform X2 n=1 Tax=Haliotis rufescens TaxID=6454 RepID=UPI00201ED57B|nr:uncharacterized protein LOC125372513 isoform X2 [Haliotis rufescens]